MSGRKLLWTQDEDNLLIDLFIQHGRCWSLISRSLFGKSSSQIFRRYVYSACKDVHLLAHYQISQVTKGWKSDHHEMDA